MSNDFHSNNSEINKLKAEIEKRDNVIKLLTGVIETIKHDLNIKEQQLDFLLDHMRNNNFEDFDCKKCINSFMTNLLKCKPRPESSSITPKGILTNLSLSTINQNLLLIILSYLTPLELITMSMTSKLFHNITSSNKLWAQIYLTEFKTFLIFDSEDKCRIIQNPTEFFLTNSSLNTNSNFYKKEYKEIKRLNKSWEESRPIVTTISTNSCITCLNLNAENNELIYSAVDGSAGLFRLYPYRKIPNEEIYMQHHKQTRICDKLSTFYGHAGPIWCIDRHDSLLFTGSYDKTIKLWEIKTGKCLYTIRAHSSWVSSIQYDSSADILLSSSWDSTIKLWNMKTYQNDLTIPNEKPDNYIYCICSDLSNGHIVDGTEYKTIDIWDVNRKEMIHSYFGHMERVNNLCLFGNLIFSGSEDKHGRIWDQRSKNCEILLSGHMRGITQIKYDANSNRVFTASIDKTIKIWDIRKNTELRTLVGHSSSVYSIDFDQGKLISGSKDNSIRMWNFLN